MFIRLRAGFATIAVVAVGLLGSTLSPVQADNGKIVYVGIGGPTQAALRKALFDPFTKETGIQVVEDTGLSDERVQAEVQSGHPTVDFLTIGTSAYLTLTQNDLLAPIDYKYFNADDLKGIADADKLKFAVGSVYSGLAMSFSKDAFPDGQPQPESWADFWDVKKFPGKRTMPFCGVLEGSWPIAEAALIADGVPMNKLYPLDMERAAKKLKELSPNVIWWKNTSQPGQYMASKEAVMELNSIGRTNGLIDKGVPLKLVWNGAQVYGDKWIVLKGAPDYDNVMKFLAFAARPQIQADLAKLIGYAPTNSHAYALLDKSFAQRLSTYPDNIKNTFSPDDAWWAANVSKWTEVCMSELTQ
jgi:putative spermidine/putrescine transport system substrate-binding protein